MRYHIVGYCIAALLIGCGGSGFTPGDNVPVEPDANGIDADAAVGVDAAIDSPQTEVEVDSQAEVDSQVEADSQIEPEADVPDAATSIDVKVCQTVCEDGKVRFCDENGILGEEIECATGCMTGGDAAPIGCWYFWKCETDNDVCKCSLVKDYPGPNMDSCGTETYKCCTKNINSADDPKDSLGQNCICGNPTESCSDWQMTGLVVDYVGMVKAVKVDSCPTLSQ